MRSITAALFFTFFCATVSAQSISIRRSAVTEECTMGYLYVNDEYIGYTLEREGKMIPAGTYQAFIRTDGQMGWRIELAGVRGRTNIQIHLGNYPWQTIGCTLLGSGANPDNCTVSGSRDAMARLKQALAAAERTPDWQGQASDKYAITVRYE